MKRKINLYALRNITGKEWLELCNSLEGTPDTYYSIKFNKCKKSYLYIHCTNANRIIPVPDDISEEVEFNKYEDNIFVKDGHTLQCELRRINDEDWYNKFIKQCNIIGLYATNDKIIKEIMKLSKKICTFMDKKYHFAYYATETYYSKYLKDKEFIFKQYDTYMKKINTLKNKFYITKEYDLLVF